MIRALTAAALAATLFAAAVPAAAQAATVEETIRALVEAKLKDPAPSQAGYLLALESNAVRYASAHGIATREVSGSGSLTFPMGTTLLTIPYVPDPAAPTVKRTLSCTQSTLFVQCTLP